MEHVCSIKSAELYATKTVARSSSSPWSIMQVRLLSDFRRGEEYSPSVYSPGLTFDKLAFSQQNARDVCVLRNEEPSLDEGGT
jgi:hypothetical protein